MHSYAPFRHVVALRGILHVYVSSLSSLSDLDSQWLRPRLLSRCHSLILELS